MADEERTSFSEVYNCFYSKITDDMYMEYTEQETADMAQDLLISAIPMFEFPRVSLEYELSESSDDTDKVSVGTFLHKLSAEQINILATYMVCQWIGQQLASIQLIRQKYTGSDFKLTSQASHIQRLMALKKQYQRLGFHLQRLYKRRKVDANGIMHSTLGTIMDEPAPFPKQKGEKSREDKI